MKRILINRVVGGVTLLAGLLFAETPQWWIERGVFDTNAAPSDYTAVNQGQVKFMAEQAKEEFEANLPLGAGTNIDLLVGSFGTNQNYTPANVGQLKYVSSPFYNRLIGIGFLQSYPWTSSTNDYALANVGQLKNLFRFDLTIDSDADGLPDIWEYEYFHGLEQTALSDPDNDQLINTREYELNAHPLDADTDDDYVQDGSEDSVHFISNAQENPILQVLGVYQALDVDPSGATVDVLFDKAIDIDGSENVANYSTESVPVDPHRSPYIDYADLDNDGDCELIIGRSRGDVVAYQNIGTLAYPLFSGPEQILQSNIGFGWFTDVNVYDLNGDARPDLVCGDLIGRLWFCQRINAADEWPPVFDAAQQLFFEIDGESLPIRLNHYSQGADGATISPLFYDIDADGDDDLLVGDPNLYDATGSDPFNGNVKVLINQGTRPDGLPIYAPYRALNVDAEGSPSPLAFQSEWFGTMKVNLFDWNGDGLDDLVLGSSKYGLVCWENAGFQDGDGFPVFKYYGDYVRDSSGNPFSAGDYPALLVEDYDDDGDRDFIISSEGLEQFIKGEVFLFENIGEPGAPLLHDKYVQIPVKNAPQPVNVGWGAKPFFQDIDGDEKADMLIGDYKGTVNLFINNDTGNDSDPCFLSRLPLFVTQEEPLPLSTLSSLSDNPPQTLLSGHQAHLSEAGKREEPFDFSTYERTPDYEHTVNTADFLSAPFSSGSVNPEQLDAGDQASPTAVDFDGDGLIEGLLVGNQNSLLFYTKNSVADSRGLPEFTMGDPINGPFDGILEDVSGDIVMNQPVPSLVDLDDDGRLDIVVAQQSAPRVVWYRNRAVDHFDLAAPVTLQAGGVDIDIGEAAAWADMDKDGDMDLFIGHGGGVHFFQNIGTAQLADFAAGEPVFADGEPISVGQAASPVIFDYNGDSWPDLIVGNFGGNTRPAFVRTYLHNGAADWELTGEGKIEIEGSVAHEAVLMENRKMIRLTFPIIAEVGSLIHLNDITVQGQRCSFSDLPVQAGNYDSDGDGLPDWWEFLYGLNPEDASGNNGADGNPDGDAYSNAEEYANGTHPLVFEGLIPYSTGFEPSPAESYVSGVLDGQDGWIASASVEVQDQIKLEEQAVEIGGFDVKTSRDFTSSADSVESIFSFYFSGTGMFPPANLPESASTLLCFDPSRGLMALDGDGSGGGEWTLVPDSLLTDQWVEIKVVLNYSLPGSPEKTWGVFLTGHGSLTGLGFKTDSIGSLNSFQIEGDAENPNYLDNLSIQEISNVPW